MAQTVAGELYYNLDGQLTEIKRQLRQPKGYPFDPNDLKKHLQDAIDGKFVGVGTVRAAKFITRGHFIVDTSLEAKVKISYLSSNFQNWHLGTVEEKRPPAKLTSFVLKTAMSDRDIIAKLGGVSKAITWLQDIDRLLKKQPKRPNSKPSRLLTNSYTNIFYVPQPVKKLDRNRFSFINSAGQEEFGGVADSQYLFELNGEWYVLRAVDVGVDWFGGGWGVDALSVEDPGEWDAGCRVFSRN